MLIDASAPKRFPMTGRVPVVGQYGVPGNAQARGVVRAGQGADLVHCEAGLVVVNTAEHHVHRPCLSTAHPAPLPPPPLVWSTGSLQRPASCGTEQCPGPRNAALPELLAKTAEEGHRSDIRKVGLHLSDQDSQTAGREGPGTDHGACSPTPSRPG